jgi:hypothetical protein
MECHIKGKSLIDSSPSLVKTGITMNSGILTSSQESDEGGSRPSSRKNDRQKPKKEVNTNNGNSTTTRATKRCSYCSKSHWTNCCQTTEWLWAVLLNPEKCWNTWKELYGSKYCIACLNASYDSKHESECQAMKFYGNKPCPFERCKRGHS